MANHPYKTNRSLSAYSYSHLFIRKYSKQLKHATLPAAPGPLFCRRLFLVLGCTRTDTAPRSRLISQTRGSRYFSSFIIIFFGSLFFNDFSGNLFRYVRFIFVFSWSLSSLCSLLILLLFFTFCCGCN